MATPVPTRKTKVFDEGNHFVRIYELFKRLNMQRDEKVMKSAMDTLLQLKNNKRDLMETYYSFLSGMGIPPEPPPDPVAPEEEDPLHDLPEEPIPDIYVPVPTIPCVCPVPEVKPRAPEPKPPVIEPIPDPIIEPIPDPDPIPEPVPEPDIDPIPDPIPVPPIPVPVPVPIPVPVPPSPVPVPVPVPEPIPVPEPDSDITCPLLPVCKLAPAICPNCPLKEMLDQLFRSQIFDEGDDVHGMESEDEVRLNVEQKGDGQKKSWLDKDVPSFSALKNWLFSK